MGGGDKGLLPLGSGRVIDHVIARLAPQCGALAINANGDPARFADFGLPVLADPVPGQPGPLAGILAAMDWAAGHGAAVVVTATPDTMSGAGGSGAVGDRAAHLYVGTSSWLSCHVTRKKTDPFHAIAALPSALPGRYLVSCEQQTAGASLAISAKSRTCRFR